MRYSTFVLSTMATVISVRGIWAQNALRAACQNADAVVTATVGVPKAVTVGAAPTILTVNVDGVIKGALSQTTSLAVNWPGWWQSVYSGVSSYRGLWFLQHNSSGMWEVLPLAGPQAGLSSSGIAIPPPDETNVVAGAGANANAASVTGAACYQTVWSLLKLDAAHIDESPGYFEAMETLFRATPDTMTDIPDFDSTVQSYANSSSPTLRSLALGTGLLQQKPQYLAQVAEQVGGLSSNLASPHIANGLMAWTNPDPTALSALAKIAQSTNGGRFSRHAVDALMKIHTKDAVPLLAGLLGSADAYLQDAAVRGLGLFVRGAPVLTSTQVKAMAYLTNQPDPELLDEGIAPYITVTPVPSGKIQEYASAWKAWWSRMSGKWPGVAPN